MARLREAGEVWADRVFLGCVLAAAPLFLFPRAQYSWVGIVLGAMLVARGAIWGRFLERTPLDWGIVGLGFMILATCFVVPDINFSMGKIAGALYGILLYYAAVAVMRRARTIKTGLYAFILVGVGLAVFGIVGAMFRPERALAKMLPGITKSPPKHNWTLPGAEEGINPNAVGGSLLWVIPSALFLAGAMLNKEKREDARGAGQKAEGTDGLATEGLKEGPTESPEGGPGLGPERIRENGSPPKRITLWPTRLPGLLLLSLASVILLAALFLSQSYGAWIALIPSVWLIGLRPKWKAWSLVAALVLCGAIYAIGPLRKVVAPLITITEKAGKGKTPTTTIVFRTKIKQRYRFWTAGVGAIRRAPAFGIGMNRLRLDPEINFEWAHAHNQFITTGAELGLPGLVAYIAILIGAGWMAWVIWKRSKDRWMRAAAMGLIAGQLAFHIFGLGDAIPLGSKPNALFWVSLALITAIYRGVRAERTSPAEFPKDEWATGGFGWDGRRTRSQSE